MNYSRQSLISIVAEFHATHKRSPKMKDIDDLPFTRANVMRVFGKWNNLLIAAGVPLSREPRRLVRCYSCAHTFLREVKEIVKVKRTFCTSACSARFYSTGRKHTEATKEKISKSLIAHAIFLYSEQE